MSTIKSSDEHLTLNADGSSKDIKFQANGVEKASISSSGAFTSTTIDATKLTGTIPNFTSTGIDDNADATAITIDSSENVGIGATTLNNNFVVLDSGTEVDSGSNASNLTAVFQKSASAGTDCGVSIASGTTGNARLYLGDSGNVTVGGLDYDNNDNSLGFLANSAERLRITSDGRGLSQFTAKFWINFNGTGSIAIRDSHNISSIADNAAGRYSVNIDNNVANANYAVTAAVNDGNALPARSTHSAHIANQAVGSFEVYTGYGSTTSSNGAAADASTVNLIGFGD